MNRQDFLFYKAKLKATFLLFQKSFTLPFRVMSLSRKPIVIGGSGRSGTTLLLSVLSCHPHIYAINDEPRAMAPGQHLNPMKKAPFKIDRIYQYLISHPIPDHCNRWCEKTPRNVLHFDRILHHFGKGVRIINMVRDGRDVVTSRHPTDPSRYWVSPEIWARDVSAGLQVEDHPQVLTIRYEDLVNHYEQTVRDVCDFINEEFVDDFLRYPESAHVQFNPAWFGTARAINPASIGRWEKSEHQHIVDEFMKTPQAVQLMEHYEYL